MKKVYLFTQSLLRVIVYSLLFCLIIFLLFSVSMKNDNSAYAEENLSTYQINVNKSVDLYGKMINRYIEKTIEKNGRCITIYSDDYGGVFIDENGLLNIGVVQNTEDNQKIEEEISNKIRYKTFEFSYNYLQKIMLEIESLMSESKISAVGIDDKENVVFVDILDAKKVDVVVEHLISKDLFNEKAIQFNIDPNVFCENTTTAYGGESIYYSSSATTYTRGTICVDVIDNVTGQFGVLTNEHVACVNSGNPVMYYGGHFGGGSFSNHDAIGNGAKGQRGGSVDAAFVPFATPSNWGITQQAKYYTTSYSNIKLGNDNQIIRGNTIMRIGQTTGVTTGEIRSTNVSVTIDGITISNTFRFTNAPEGGDSGGPIYYTDGTNRYLIGMNFARGSVFLGGTQGYACRISNVMNALDVTPMTNDFMTTTNWGSNCIRLDKVSYGISGEFTVPDEISGRSVVSIGSQAFRYQTGMTAINLPNSISTIGDRAFQFCYDLKTVDLSATSVTRIEDYTFDTCALGSFTFPLNIVSIGEGAFIRTGNVNAMPASVTTIGDYAFAYRTEALGAYLPDNLFSIGAYSFAYCDGFILTNEDTGLTIIGPYAFYNTVLSLNTRIPAAVTTIGDSAFENSGFSSKFALPSGSLLSTIGHRAFSNCGISTIVLPTTVTTICNDAFSNNNELTIYTENISKPSSWSSSWNSSNRPVFWECALSNDKTYVKSFTKSTSNPSNANNGISNPFRKDYSFGGWYENDGFTGTQYMDVTTAPNVQLFAKWNESACVAEGTLITLADGSQVAVEDLTGDEYLLVWNMLTGEYDSAPIFFIDRDPYQAYEVITLTFSDNTQVKVIYEHAFFDITIGEYVFLRNDAAQYIGHYFNKQNGNIWTTVQLTNVAISNESTTAWSPVTYGHLCYYVNGMLSMPGATEGLINIFDVDATLMKYDAAQMAADIQTYGLYTYAEFNTIIPLPEFVFNAFNGQYLKVSIGKGLTTLNEIEALLERYKIFFN